MIEKREARFKNNNKKKKKSSFHISRARQGERREESNMEMRWWQGITQGSLVTPWLYDDVVIDILLPKPVKWMASKRGPRLPQENVIWYPLHLAWTPTKWFGIHDWIVPGLYCWDNRQQITPKLSSLKPLISHGPCFDWTCWVVFTGPVAYNSVWHQLGLQLSEGSPGL